MANIKQKTIGNNILLFDPEHFANVSAEMFNDEYWHLQGKVTGQAFGRGTTTFFNENNQDYVLRHYLRGGLIGKIVENSYVFTGLIHTRAWAEMYLLNWMTQQGLPVPQAVAARVIRQGLFYQADIILSKIPQAKDSFSLLQSAKLSEDLWHRIGVCIRQFHLCQIHHHDLNIHNIMIDDQEKIWLIDFDKCAVRAGEQWKNGNLQRLKRSLLKEKTKHSGFQWRESDWRTCMQGYNDNN